MQPLSARIFGHQGVQNSSTWTDNLCCFIRLGLLKASQPPGQPEEIPYESIIRDPPGDVRAKIAEWSERLNDCIGAEGSQFD